MGLKDDLTSFAKSIVEATWDPRDGRVVPDVDAIALKDGAVDIDGAVLYADLADSTGLVDKNKRKFAAHVTRLFLGIAGHVIRASGGKIRSFDGDRIMAVFMGEKRVDAAAGAAFKLDFATSQILLPALKSKWTLTGWQFRYGCGLDVSDMTVIKAGPHGNNDLVWLGPAANHAARLSGKRDEGFTTFCTPRFFERTSMRTTTIGSAVWMKAGAALSEYYRSNGNIPIA